MPNHKLTLRPANKRRAILETKDRYDLLINGEHAGNVYFNMTGYLIDRGLPLPNGKRLFLPEGSLGRIKREIAYINREAKKSS